MFGDIEIERRKFHYRKKVIFVKDVDIDNILISKKISSGKKSYQYFIGYMDDYRVKPFSIILTKTSAYVKMCEGET